MSPVVNAADPGRNCCDAIAAYVGCGFLSASDSACKSRFASLPEIGLVAAQHSKRISRERSRWLLSFILRSGRL